MGPGSPLQKRFPLLFLGTAILLMGGYYVLPQAIIENVIVRFFAVVPGAWLLDLITPELPVSASGTRIVSPLVNLNVLKGCEGTETLLLLYAAIVASVRRWTLTLTGLMLGTVLVFLLNQLRILVLFFVAGYQGDWFELVHGFLAPLLILGAVVIFFIIWSRWEGAGSGELRDE
ncbi:MAG: exosortase/archaeosortase family protein [Pseudomonadales bacterium]|nr:exosortase/archaeosortase family protein [Pseudomonadales bacterium]